ncbi:hypothetical protein MBLNU457_1545t1 [Dothideomycetes sp. NU457]
MSSVTYRDARPEDFSTITEIYNHYINTSVATFEEDAVSIKDMQERFNIFKTAGLPYIVAEEHGRVIGYAYLSYWRTRSAFRFSVENTVYLAPGNERKGVGKRLVQLTLDAARSIGRTSVVSAISVMPDQSVETSASVMLHLRTGFEVVGRMHKVGYKFGKWIDVVWLEYDLMKLDSKL